MTRVARFWGIALPLGALLLFPTPARAAEVHLEASARRAAIGQTITVQLTAVLEGDESAEAPSLPVRGAAEVRGPSLMTQRRMVMQNFNFRTENNVVASYQIRPTQAGTLSVGPGTFLVGGKTLKSEALSIEVVDGPAPSDQQSRTLRGRDPFGFGRDPFGQDPFGQDPFDRLLQGRRSSPGHPDAPAELRLDQAPNDTGFLVARLSQPTAVIGEPVVLSIYAYGGRGSFREISPTEPALPDFLSYASVETSHEQPFFRVDVGGREYLVVKLRELVLVPLRSGELTIGSMRAVLRGRGYPNQGSALGFMTESPEIRLSVHEPPLGDRPPDYQLGDVGRFDLSAKLEPRTLSANDFFSLAVEISGEGNLPSTLVLPRAPGVVWGQPTVRGEVGVKDRDLAGTRRLEYTAKASEPGSIELGTLRLPYFDPKTGSYRVAKVELGSLDVKPAAATPAVASAPSDASAHRAAESRELLLAITPRAHATAVAPPATLPPRWVLALVAALPGVVYLLTLLQRALASFTERRKARSPGKKRLDLKGAARAETAANRSEAARELERVAYELIEDRTGLRARAVLKEHLARELSRVGVDAPLAEELQALLQTLELERYQTAAGPASGDSLVAAAKPPLERLARLRPTSARSSV